MPDTMRGALHDGGDKVNFRAHLAMPASFPGSALIRVRQSGICGSDLHMNNERTEEQLIPSGHEVAGEIVELPDGESDLQVGDHVAIEIGQAAPDFTLVDENNQEVTLSKLRGSPVVLVFYAFDFSGICTNELCEIRDSYQDWSGLGAQVYGISRDARFSHAAFKEQHNLSHSLLADTKGVVAKAYHTWNEDLWAAERLTVVIDKDGNITHIQKNPIPEARDHSMVAEAVKAAL